jgi:hypothetical protein
MLKDQKIPSFAISAQTCAKQALSEGSNSFNKNKKKQEKIMQSRKDRSVKLYFIVIFSARLAPLRESNNKFKQQTIFTSQIPFPL